MTRIVIEGVRTIARARNRRRLSDCYTCQSIGVRDESPRGGLCPQVACDTVLRHEVADHEAKEAAVAETLVDWTIVRPPQLTNGRLTRSYRVGDGHSTARSPLPMMSRADVADFMLRQLQRSVVHP
jgi:hypothetical protein